MRALYYLASGSIEQIERVAYLILASRAMLVDFIAEQQDGTVNELLVVEYRLELIGRLGESLPIPDVDEKHDGINRREVVLPYSAHFKFQS